MQTSMLKMPMRTACANEEYLPHELPVFKDWADIEASFYEADKRYKQGNFKLWDEAFADIKARYSS